MSNAAMQSFPRRRHAHTALDQRTLAEQRKAEEAAREKALYGNALPDAQLLRRVGYVVNAEKGKFRVGNKLVDKAGLVAMAERERRLIGDGARTPATTANGQKVGHVERLAPKKVPQRTLPAPRTNSAKSGLARPNPAKAVEHSTNLGTKPRVVWLDLGLLVVDKKYQRDIGRRGLRHIARITKTWNWNCYQPIIVAERADGKFGVIDGQHRLEAAKLHPLVKELPCYVVDAPDVAAQAAIFTTVNSVRLGLSSLQKFAAAVVSGDPAATVLQKICASVGVTIPRGNPVAVLPPMTLTSPLVCQRLVATLGEKPVREAFQLIADVHAKTPGAFRSHFIEALTRIAAQPGYSRDRMRRSLAAIDPKDLHDKAVAARGGAGSGLGGAVEQILRKAA